MVVNNKKFTYALITRRLFKKPQQLNVRMCVLFILDSSTGSFKITYDTIDNIVNHISLIQD